MHGELALLAVGTFGIAAGTAAYVLHRSRVLRDRLGSFLRRPLR